MLFTVVVFEITHTFTPWNVGAANIWW